MSDFVTIEVEWDWPDTDDCFGHEYLDGYIGESYFCDGSCMPSPPKIQKIPRHIYETGIASIVGNYEDSVADYLTEKYYYCVRDWKYVSGF